MSALDEMGVRLDDARQQRRSEALAAAARSLPNGWRLYGYGPLPHTDRARTLSGDLIGFNLSDLRWYTDTPLHGDSEIIYAIRGNSPLAHANLGPIITAERELIPIGRKTRLID